MSSLQDPLSGAAARRDPGHDDALGLHRLFERQAARRPEAVALVHDGRRMRYAELNARANRLAQRLIDAGVSAVFGHFNSGVSIPAASVYAKAGIPQMSVSTNPKYTRQNLPTTFRLTADDIQQGAMLGKLVSDKLRAKSIFLVDDKTTFGIGLIEEVKKVLAAKQVTPPQASLDAKTAQEGDYAELARKITSANADAVLFAGDEAVGIPLLKALRHASSGAKFIVADAMCDPSTIKHAEGFADNSYYCTIAGVPPSWLSTGIGFMELYKTKYNGMPGAYSPLAYDGIHVFAQAMQEAGSAKPETFMPVMKTKSFDGKVQGTVEFDARGDIKDGTVVVFQAVSGQLTEQKGLF